MTVHNAPTRTPLTPEQQLAQAVAILEPLTNPEPPEKAAYLDSQQALLDCALAYAAAGWPVLPIAAGGKIPVTSNGLHDATTKRTTITEWWRTMPSCNIGVRTGVAFDVIDIDAPHGFDSWVQFVCDLIDNNLPSPEVLASARTGSGGVHLLIAPVPGARNGARLGGKPGLDYRADGGYILVAPSRLRGGERYRWIQAPDHRLLGGS